MLKQNVFNRLIEALNDNLMFKKNVLPDVYFMWLIVHFLRVSQQGGVQFDKIKYVEQCTTIYKYCKTSCISLTLGISYKPHRESDYGDFSNVRNL